MADTERLTGDDASKRARLAARAAELEREIAAAREALVAKRALVERGGRAPAGPARRTLAQFIHLIGGLLMVLAVLLVAWILDRF